MPSRGRQSAGFDAQDGGVNAYAAVSFLQEAHKLPQLSL